MKKIGILGGLAWPSTVDYYAGLCRLAQSAHADAERTGIVPMPEIAIESLDVATAVSLLGKDGDETSWAAFDRYHRAALQRLQQGGCRFAVIASNTAHHRFEAITRGIGIPVLNIVEIAARACAEAGVRRVLILGTATVMRSAVFRTAFARHGIEATAPRRDEDRLIIVDTIEALQGGHPDGTAARIHAVAAGVEPGPKHGAAAVYLGCTELPQAFPGHAHSGMFVTGGIRYVNSTALHIRAAFDHALDASTWGASTRAIFQPQAGVRTTEPPVFGTVWCTAGAPTCRLPGDRDQS